MAIFSRLYPEPSDETASKVFFVVGSGTASALSLRFFAKRIIYTVLATGTERCRNCRIAPSSLTVVARCSSCCTRCMSMTHASWDCNCEACAIVAIPKVLAKAPRFLTPLAFHTHELPASFFVEERVRLASTHASISSLQSKTDASLSRLYFQRNDECGRADSGPCAAMALTTRTRFHYHHFRSRVCNVANYPFRRAGLAKFTTVVRLATQSLQNRRSIRSEALGHSCRHLLKQWRRL